AIWFNLRAIGQLLIFSLFGMLAVQYTYMASIELGNAAIATMLQYLAPIFIVIYLLLTKMEALQRSDIVSVTITIIGTFLLLTNGSVSTITVPFPAVVWGVLSGIAVAFYTLFARQIMIAWGSLSAIG